MGHSILCMIYVDKYIKFYHLSLAPELARPDVKISLKRL